jgi:23S rRNA pseudouridine2605 synthase
LNSPDNSEEQASPGADGSDGAGNDSRVRLQLYIARAGIASRRAAERLIADGLVTVNGVVVTEMGTKVGPLDSVSVNGVEARPEETKRYVLLHKPAGYVCTQRDERGRPIAADLLRDAYPERLYGVGRLDMWSSGALIFTNDGDFAATVAHPSAEVEKEYLVETSLPMPEGLAKSFVEGVRVGPILYRARQAERLSPRRLRVVLIEGKNREIRRVLEAFEIRVQSLARVRIGPVALGDLPSGGYRDLTAREIEALRGFPGTRGRDDGSRD